MDDNQTPQAPEAEAAVIGRCLHDGAESAGQVVGSLLEASHFYSPGFRILYEAITEAYYADEDLDALSIGRLNAKKLAPLWSCSEDDAAAKVRDLVETQSLSGRIKDHAKLVKRASDYRLLLKLSKSLAADVHDGEKAPEEIAGITSTRATRIATNALINDRSISFADLGREFINEERRVMEARKKGIELGAYFGLPFVDEHTHGVQPTEMWALAGPPGAGKTAIGWIAGMNFAERQLTRPEDKRIGTYVLSLEMGDVPSKVRLAQTLSGIDSGRIRDGTLSDSELKLIWDKWMEKSEWPMHFNFTSRLKASQLRALVVENIRRHNIGLVIIDHFRHFRMDEHYTNRNDEDDDKVLFLKEDIAKDLNVAVVCIMHTTKGWSQHNVNRRPTLDDLRGSGMVAAAVDFVSFMYRPYKHASDEEKDSGEVKETDAEMIWEKSRFGEDDRAFLSFNPKVMRVGPRL